MYAWLDRNDLQVQFAAFLHHIFAHVYQMLSDSHGSIQLRGANLGRCYLDFNFYRKQKDGYTALLRKQIGSLKWTFGL